MRSKGMNYSLALMLGTSALTLISCGGGDGDSARLAQTVDASKNGITSVALADTDGYVHSKGSIQLNLIGTDANKKTINLNNTASWSLDNPALGSIKNGLFTPSGTKGDVLVNVSYAGLPDTQELEIVDNKIESIEISNSSTSVDVCRTTSFTSKTFFEGGLQLNYSLTWEFSDTASASLAKFKDSSSGVMTATKSGTVKVIASGKTTDDNQKTSNELSFVINDSLSAIALTSGTATNLTLRTGQTATVKAMGTYLDNSSVDITDNISIESDKTNALTYDAVTKKITAKTGSFAGEAVKLTASCNGKTSVMNVTVVKPELKSIEVIGSSNLNSVTSLDVAQGSNITLRVKVAYADSGISEEVYIANNVRWEISDASDPHTASNFTLTTNSNGSAKLEVVPDAGISSDLTLVLKASILDANNNVEIGSNGQALTDTINVIVKD